MHQSVCKLPAMVEALSAHAGPKAQLLSSVLTVPLKVGYMGLRRKEGRKGESIRLFIIIRRPVMTFQTS